MTYVVITADGVLHVEAGSPTMEKIYEFVGPEGWARAFPHREYGAAAWVNDCALLFPDRYPRNVVGSCVIASIGAVQQPYAGTMVITGYAFDEDGWPEELPADTFATVRALHAAVSDIVAGTLGEAPHWASPEWPAEIAKFAAAVRDAETPGWRIR